jgi:hypothetical protein
MPTSLFLAQLIGPTLAMMGVGMLAAPAGWRARLGQRATQLLDGPALARSAHDQDRSRP